MDRLVRFAIQWIGSRAERAAKAKCKRGGWLKEDVRGRRGRTLSNERLSPGGWGGVGRGVTGGCYWKKERKRERERNASKKVAEWKRYGEKSCWGKALTKCTQFHYRQSFVEPNSNNEVQNARVNSWSVSSLSPFISHANARYRCSTNEFALIQNEK